MEVGGREGERERAGHGDGRGRGRGRQRVEFGGSCAKTVFSFYLPSVV